MDLPDIQVVVQWMPTCTLCTLWQRFGHGARGDGYRAMAILLVPKRVIHEKPSLQEGDDTKQARSSNLKQKSHTHDTLPVAKSPVLTDKSLNSIRDSKDVVMEESQGDESMTISTVIEECRNRYAWPDSVVTNGQGKKCQKPVQEGSPIDDYINAHHLSNCRRVVVMTYFGNDKTSMWAQILLSG